MSCDFPKNISKYAPDATTVRIPAGIAKPKFIFPFSSIVATMPITSPVIPHTI